MPTGTRRTKYDSYGRRKNPSVGHLVNLGIDAKLPKKLVESVVEQTRDALAKWEYLSKDYGVESSKIEVISKYIN